MIRQKDFYRNEDLISFQKEYNVDILQVEICEEYKTSFDSKFYKEFGKQGKIVKEYFTRIIFKEIE